MVYAMLFVLDAVPRREIWLLLLLSRVLVRFVGSFLCV